MQETLSKEEMIREFLNSVRPALLRHEGDVSLIKVEDNKVYLKFEGNCVDCNVRSDSMFPMLKNMLMQKFPWIKEVVDLTV